MNDTLQLLREIEAFLVSTGMAATTFGQKSVRNWKLVDRLRNGGSVTLPQAAKIRAFMNERRSPRPRPKGNAPAVERAA